MKDYKAIYEEWLSNPYFDQETKEELRAIRADEKEIKERFYMDLEFGTAGLRGVIGAGINRMNIYTVRRATQGLADYILEQGGAERGVAIAYDSRRMSPEFSDEAARTLAANGIKAYRFESLRPTPELSFAVRELGCIAGINITASHNPPEYNGYKVYWEDGAQFTPPHDKGVTEKVMAITDLSAVRTMSREEAESSGLYVTIGAEIDDKYIAQVKAQVVNQAAIDRMQDQISIVYTPLHGTGNIPARRVMKELGFEHVYVVPEQELPDGNFPTVSYPNPEAEEAFELGLKLAKEKNADLVLATDPDADRLGVYVKDDKTKVTSVTGNDGKVTYTVDLSDFILTTEAGTTIEVKYSAIVENDHTYNNSATVNSNTVNYVPGIVNGYTGNVTLKKVDTNGNTLNGAEFQLLEVTPAEKKGAEATKTPINVVKVKDGEYKVALDGEEGATPTLVATSGTLKVTGLDEGNYEFKETKAPTGYKVNSENKAFTIEANETAEVKVDAGNFVNTKLSSLPSTGGMGTYLFTIIGVVVMAGAAGAFFISRRKGSEE